MTDSTSYPPAPPPLAGGDPAPAPPPKKRRRWPWVVAGLLVIVVIAAVAGGGSEDDDPPVNTETNDGPDTESGNTDNPPPDDVTLDVCGSGEANFIEAGGLITNHSSKASTYFIEVEFVDASGTRYGEGIASSSTVAPDQKVEWSASGLVEPRPDTTCRVTSVERFAA